MKKFITAILLSFLPILSFAGEHVVKEKSMSESIDEVFGNATGWFVEMIFYTIPFTDTIQVPWVLIVLVGGAIFFTIYFKFINFTKVRTAIRIVRGKYDSLEEGNHVEVSDTVHVDEDGDNPDTIRIEGDHGEVSHFQALTAALSATVGLGNIAGVAVAISIGGPGATFWMIVAGMFGMASKFTECTLGVKYREIDKNGTVFGGPMYYLKKGLAEKKMKVFGRILAILFAIMCIGGSFGGGNMFQVNQAFEMFRSSTMTSIAAEDIDGIVNENSLIHYDNGEKINGDFNLKKADDTFYLTSMQGEETVETEVSEANLLEFGSNIPMDGKGIFFGIIMAVLVGIVIIGGIKKIAKVTDKIVPFMVGIYALAVIVVIVVNIELVPSAFGQIFSSAFGIQAVAGGMIGVLIQGFKRAAFSNEAGIGSASIAHSAVKTKNPASEGLVALLEPFIDTVVVCTLTALVLVIANMDGNIMTYGQEVTAGVNVTASAFAETLSWFPYVLAVAVILFAFSSMVSWSYYGYQAWSFLFGKKKSTGIIYRVIFCLFVVVGAAIKLDSVINFSDAMIFAMLVPNIIGLVILAPKAKEELKKYMAKIKAAKL